jgi:hypothetical protein
MDKVVENYANFTMAATAAMPAAIIAPNLTVSLNSSSFKSLFVASFSSTSSFRR